VIGSTFATGGTGPRMPDARRGGAAAAADASHRGTTTGADASRARRACEWSRDCTGTSAPAYHRRVMEDPLPPAAPPPRAPAELELATAGVAQIVAAAEQAAEALRASAEQRALDRIAEADRAAALRVQAADDDAEQVRAEVAADAEQLRAAAAQSAQEARHEAGVEAREIIADARAAAREVLREGEQLSGHLRELGDALRTNAERLLRDIRHAHAELTARLDRADPGPASPGRDGRSVPSPDGLDVPEFVPRA